MCSLFTDRSSGVATRPAVWAISCPTKVSIGAREDFPIFFGRSR
jgi:hypothetical protein